MIGEPALAMGNTIVVGNHQLEVERACSGLRIFVGIAALAYVYVMLVRRSWWEKCLLLIAVVPIALISNAARIVVTAYMYRHVSVEAGKKFTHDAAGLAMIVLAAALFGLLLWYLKWLVRDYTGRRRRRFDPARDAAASDPPCPEPDDRHRKSAARRTKMAEPVNPMSGLPQSASGKSCCRVRKAAWSPCRPRGSAWSAGRRTARPRRATTSGSGLSFALNVLRRWWLIATPVGLDPGRTGSAAVWYTFKPQYEAAAWLKIDERAPYLAFQNKEATGGPGRSSKRRSK